MEDNYRNNITEFCMIYLDKEFNNETYEQTEFNSADFTHFIFKELLNININQNGNRLDNNTKKMNNDKGDLKIYKENDSKKDKYIVDIKKGDLVFFHKQSLESTTPTPSNKFPGHVGIYLGNNHFIHSPANKEKITIEKLENEWLNTLVASRDIIAYLIN